MIFIEKKIREKREDKRKKNDIQKFFDYAFTIIVSDNQFN